MQTIFFIKTSSATPTENNSVILRFKLAETGKYKVKGLGISCSKKDWNQEDQRVRRSHPEYVRLNDQLSTITSELEKIQKERVIKSEDVDTIVEASIKGISVKDLKDKSQYLLSMVNDLYNDIKDVESYSYNYKRKFESVARTLEAFEKDTKIRISGATMNKESLVIQKKLTEYFRQKGRKDSSIKNFITLLNAAINHYNKHNGNEIQTFVKGDVQWSKIEKETVFLNNEELKKLYNLVFNPEMYPNIKPKPAELRNMKYFLFRCFCGMRIGDMNASNVTQEKLTKDSTTFTYSQAKGEKKVTVFCLGTYLYDIATSLDWKFPTYLKQTTLTSYSRRETDVLRKYLMLILAGNMRKIWRRNNKEVKDSNLAIEVSTHTARKTFAHLLYNLSGNNLLLVMKQLGHTKLEVTQGYLGIDLNEITIDFKNVNLGF